MSERSAATIQDVALLAGVSASTVSRALSGKIPVHPDTMLKIAKAAEQLHYAPSMLAQSLKGGSSRTIGLIVPDITNPVFPAIALGAETEAVRRGYQVFLAHSHEQVEQEKELVRLLIQRQVDGLLVATACRGQDSPAEWLSARVPVWQLVRRQTDRLPSVTADQIQVGCLAAEHLLAGGCRRPAILIGNRSLAVYRDRLAGFCRAMGQAGLDASVLQIINSSQQDVYGIEATVNLMQQALPAFDGIFAATDMQALGIMRALGRQQIKVPGQVAVVGVDNLGISSICTPPITCIRQPLLEIGRLACQRLLDAIQAAPAQLPRRHEEARNRGPELPAASGRPVQHDLLPCELVRGETS